MIYISHQNLIFKNAEHYNHYISTLLGFIWNKYLSFYAFKAADVLLIGSFSSSNPPPILISSRVPWYNHQPMNGVWQELNPPLMFPNIYILLISCHANFQKKTPVAQSFPPEVTYSRKSCV